MPTLNEYSDDSGYYIVARPSGADSPITYQIKPEGGTILESYGLSHQDEVSWDTIQALKSLQLVYTGKSGTLATDDFEPDSAQLEKTSLSEQEAEELIKSIRENSDLSLEQVRELCSILEVEPIVEELIEVTIPLSSDIIQDIEEKKAIVEEWGREEHALFYKILRVLDEAEDDNGVDADLTGVANGYLAGHLTGELVSTSR